jgi:peptidoglycan/LPS O-acetylase OafA/YrhL
LLLFYFFVSLAAACITVWTIYRFIVRPLREGRRRKAS